MHLSLTFAASKSDQTLEAWLKKVYGERWAHFFVQKVTRKKFYQPFHYFLLLLPASSILYLEKKH